MILPILATCLNLQVVTLNGVAMPCNAGLVQYYPREREVRIGKTRVTGQPYPSLRNLQREVRIVGREVAVFGSGFE